MQFNLSRFTYDSKGKSLAADASDLGFKVGEVPGCKIFDDACDIGFFVKSDNTDKVFTFLLAFETNSYWQFVPYEKSCPVETLIIFND